MEFEEIVQKYSGIITKLCYYFASNTDEFEDLRQDVLINIWKGFEKFRKESSISTWIYRVCFNTCVTYQRKKSNRISSISIESIIDIPDDDIYDINRYNEMHSLINQLNLNEKAIIMLWLDEKTYDEISEITGITRNTIAVKIKRIKEKLIKLSNH